MVGPAMSAMGPAAMSAMGLPAMSFAALGMPPGSAAAAMIQTPFGLMGTAPRFR